MLCIASLVEMREYWAEACLTEAAAGKLLFIYCCNQHVGCVVQLHVSAYVQSLFLASVMCLLTRYEKYDKPMGKRRESKGGDPYCEEYDILSAEVDDLYKVGSISTHTGCCVSFIPRNGSD